MITPEILGSIIHCNHQPTQVLITAHMISQSLGSSRRLVNVAGCSRGGSASAAGASALLHDLSVARAKCAKAAGKLWLSTKKLILIDIIPSEDGGLTNRSWGWTRFHQCKCWKMDENGAFACIGHTHMVDVAKNIRILPNRLRIWAREHQDLTMKNWLECLPGHDQLDMSGYYLRNSVISSHIIQ